MQTYSFKILGSAFVVVCEFWETSQAWGHKVTVLKDGQTVGAARVRYYNRTWETFRYQTCIYNAIDEARKKAAAFLTSEYKQKNGYKVLTAGRRADLERVLAHDHGQKQYVRLYNNICAANHV